MKMTVCLIAAVVLLMGMAAMAQNAAPAPEAKAEKVHKAGKGGAFEKADANKDGRVSLDEAKAAMPKMTEERFKKFDKNGDGYLGKNEFPRERIGEILKKADKDKDGKVTFAEWKAVRPNVNETQFKKMDKNGDGVLTKADFAKHAPAAK